MIRKQSHYKDYKKDTKAKKEKKQSWFISEEKWRQKF